MNQWHKLAVDINFRKRKFTFTVDDSCLGTFPFLDGFSGNVLRRGSFLAYVASDTATLVKANYSSAYDQFIISEVDEPEDCIK